MKFSILLAVTLAALFILVRPSPAAAEFTVCNSSTYGDVSIAWAATWSDGNGNAHGESVGWFIIAQGDCKIVITASDISAYTIYIYGKASKQYWGGGYNYCLDTSHKFLYQGDDMKPPCSSGRSFGMRYMDTGSSSTYTYYLRD